MGQAQSHNPVLPIDRGLEFARLRAARLVRNACTRGGKRYTIRGHFNASMLSRAKKGHASNPRFRISVLLRAMKQAGEERSHAELILADIAAEIDELWPYIEVELLTAYQIEGDFDAVEDAAQNRVLCNLVRGEPIDEGGIDAHERALDDQLLAGNVLRTAIRRWRARGRLTA